MVETFLSKGEAFAPKGSEAEWQMIYKVLIHMEVGQIIDYPMLDTVLGRPFRDSRTPIYRAKAELLTNYKRLLRSVSGVGYRIAEPDEHEDVARAHVRSGHRQIVKAKDLVSDTPRTGLSPEKRRSLDAFQTHLVTVAKATGALNRRVETGKTRADEAIDETRREVQATVKGPDLTTAEVAAKVERLERLVTRFQNAEPTSS